MGKYEPLTSYLKTRPGDSWTAQFAEVERQLGFALPRSAYEHRAWWANQRDGNHSQSVGWQQAGWETREVDLRKRIVRFERALKPAVTPSRDAGEEALWRRAAEISGISDRNVLARAALTSFIQKEAARELVGLGGAMPDLSVPDRERPGP